MRPISPKLRSQLTKDPEMQQCIVCQNTQVQWHHAFKYAGRQVNEPWSIVPLCLSHHQNLDNLTAQKWGMKRMETMGLFDNMKENYPKSDFLDKYIRGYYNSDN